MFTRTLALVFTISLLACSAVFAQDGKNPVDGGDGGDFKLDASTSLEIVDVGETFAKFGQGETAWWSFGAGVASDGDATDVNAYAMMHWFIADDFEFNLTFGGFYHSQERSDTGSGNLAVGWRWHFVSEPAQTWYIDFGIGLLGSPDEVPDGGTRLNFTPRAGVGTTIKLFEDSPTRLDLGVRWHHISNGSFAGSDDNPSRDSIMFYMGVMMPF